MKIAVYVPGSGESLKPKFIVGTFFPLFERFPRHELLFITDKNSELKLPSQFEVINIKPQPKNPLLKKLWIERTLTRELKKAGANVFVSADDFCSLNMTLPQCILMPNAEKIKPAYISKAQLLIVTSGSEKEKLTNKFKIPADKITVVYPSPGKNYFPVDTEKRESIKDKYSENKEYFLYNSIFRTQEDLINLLKSFSHFKKRQQSSFKLLLITESNFSFKKSIGNYKYRDDVAVIGQVSEKENAEIIATAYAVVLPFDTYVDIAASLKAMQSGIPVITARDSSINEVAGGAVLYGDNEIKDIGEKMMQLYKDEGLRSALIEKGKETVKNFTQEKSAADLWQSIMKVLN